MDIRQSAKRVNSVFKKYYSAADEDALNHSFQKFVQNFQEAYTRRGNQNEVTQRNPSLEALTEWFYVVRESNRTKASSQEAQQSSQLEEMPVQVLKGKSAELSVHFPEEETAFQEVGTDTQEQERNLLDAIEEPVDVQVVVQNTDDERAFSKATGDHTQVSAEDEAGSEADTQRIVKKVELLMNLLDVLHQRLQQHMTSSERNSLDSLLFTTLQLLTRIEFIITDSLQEDLVTLQPHGAHECVLHHITHQQDRIVVEVMKFLSVLVYKGNRKAQEEICQFLKYTDTELFSRMQQIFEKASTSISAEVENDQSKVQNESKEAMHQVGVALDLVAWICDGQQLECQELFREQESQFKSVNIVSQVAILFQDISRSLDSSLTEFHDVTLRAIQALIELCTGNLANQQTVLNAQILDTIHDVLVHKPAQDNRKHLILKSRSLELLDSLLEETSNQSFMLFQRISQDIPLASILDTMLELWKLQEHSSFERTTIRNGMFYAFHILRRVANNKNKQTKEFESELRMIHQRQDPLQKPKECCKPGDKECEEFKEVYKSIKKSSRRIEVLYKGESQEPLLTRVYFQFDPSEEISVDDKHFIGEHIKRSSPEDKLTDLIKWMKAIHVIREHKKRVFGPKLLPLVFFMSKIQHSALILLTLLLNLLTIIYFQAPENQDNSPPGTPNRSVFVTTSNFLAIPPKIYPIVLILGFLHLIFSIFMIFDYFATMRPNFCYQVPVVRNFLYSSMRDIRRAQLYCKSLDKKIKSFQRSLKNSKCRPCVKLYNICSAWSHKPKELECFRIYFFGFKTLYRILFVLFSLAALVHSGYWYSGCLLFVFLKSKLLAQVLTALYKSARQLIAVFLLGLSVIFIYAVISFVFFHTYFNEEEGFFCSTLAQCFATVTRVGLLTTLGEAIALQRADEESPSFVIYSWRVFVDLSFFIIVTTIGLNIVIAIMVDRFSELREERDKIVNDKEQFCFVCSKESDDFERDSLGFKEHIVYDHNMWSYIYFYLYLEAKENNDHNALEKYVYEQIHRKNIQFFPLRRAKVLEEQENGREKDDNEVKTTSVTDEAHLNELYNEI